MFGPWQDYTQDSQTPNDSLPSPSKIICIGRNYAAHAAELNNEIPAEPVIFLKPPSSLVDTGGQVVLPPQSNDVHHEVELVVEIGETCKDVGEDRALGVIRSCAVGLDMTARDLQSKAKEKRLPWAVAKGFDTFSPVGPMVSAKGVDMSDLAITLTVNGTVRQRGHTSLMLFPVPKLITYCSSIFTLEAGDLIFTGTPKGVGPVHHGDRLEGRIAGLPPLNVLVTRNA
jgi:2-keto-4-pentenoate hydratase/2-oxohepta-3-ene-1,7-dioic acid hydratase in catechol pathway